MPAADKLPPLREVIAAHGLAPRKSLGQNFLLDLNLTRKIARAAGANDGGVFYEVGPGPGGLTRQVNAALGKSGPAPADLPARYWAKAQTR